LNWTEAQKKQTKNYQPGQILEFHKAVRGIARKNEALEVISANKTSVTARRNNGEAVQIVGKHGKAFGVFEKDTVEVAAGDKLLLQSNWKTKEFKATNGELVTVSGIEAGKIRLQDGRELPNNYRQFSSGYVITSHKSQAKTVDAGIVAAERMPRDQFYVAVTRSRESVTVITSDSVGLAESIGASADRQSAIELAERAAHIAARAHRFEHEDHQVYQKFQQHQRPVLRTEIQQEINHNASTHRIGY
jgi:ATP-dependent exoDNAse (exonuclease V) alpha subunit